MQCKGGKTALPAEHGAPKTWCAQMDEIQKMLNKPYKWGFTTDIESERIPKGLSEDTVRLISAKKNEPEWYVHAAALRRQAAQPLPARTCATLRWHSPLPPHRMLEFRLKAYRKWLTMEEPDWSDNQYPQIDYNAYYYYSEPKQKARHGRLAVCARIVTWHGSVPACLA